MLGGSFQGAVAFPQTEGKPLLQTPGACEEGGDTHRAVHREGAKGFCRMLHRTQVMWRTWSRAG